MGSKADPLALFQSWFDDAVRAGEPEPDAMVLATSTKKGAPSARVVLLKGIQDGAFTFYTNYDSRKGKELADNSRVALVFWWQRLSRQLRVEGVAKKLSAAQSDAYWNSRPRGSQIGGAISRQSRPIENVEVLRKAAPDFGQGTGRAPIARPKMWGGFGVVPSKIEFWTRGSDRIHERREFSRTSAKALWKLRILSP